MQLDSTFSVTAPIDEVWATLMDFERVAGCVPGAQILNRLSDDAYQVGMKVKLGPVAMQYKGMMNVIERDADAHRAVFEGRAQEARGQGTAQGTATLVLTEADGTTHGTVNADVDLSGKVAVMGKSIIGSVTDQMMALFAENLQAMLSEAGAPADTAPADSEPAEIAPAGAEPAPTAPIDVVRAADTATQAPRSPSAPVAAPIRPTTPPVSRKPAAAAESSLDALTLAKSLIMDRLSNPAVLAGLLVVTGFVGYRLGKHSGGRRAGDSRQSRRQ
ncbi:MULTISPECIES: SRPBCC family protein [unclassified Cryobacterium]|uniref:SRPBCC family protein n=1 Tax=unclassified Cryobacterium TaxID=2649013 RepID=UPI002AB53A1F|nr:MULTISPECIES: SRPBCC domain-containing protein [unclassified Cryobacterium]MDY7543793.1 SRPBCC domain-containing protein [Cryobacterium sp. 5B3]MEA9997599.1 SRPBCC domain-containing protein [Cryobacterium sp. RTS3]MEB0264237.1 SRPBCC domain-containing protein [Cryobacterium sp. 10I5]MEB0275200.1 SRPBCC domain-containing protein [Cryobacterium sp. 5B3]